MPIPRQRRLPQCLVLVTNNRHIFLKKQGCTLWGAALFFFKAKVQYLPLIRYPRFTCGSFIKSLHDFIGVKLFLKTFFRGAEPHDSPSFIAAFRPEVNDVIRGFNHIQIVFDHNDRIPFVHQSGKHIK